MHRFLKIFVEVELEDTRQENMTLRWQNGAISNFEYLMYLNRLVFILFYSKYNSHCDKRIYFGETTFSVLLTTHISQVLILIRLRKRIGCHLTHYKLYCSSYFCHYSVGI